MADTLYEVLSLNKTLATVFFEITFARAKYSSLLLYIICTRYLVYEDVCE